MNANNYLNDLYLVRYDLSLLLIKNNKTEQDYLLIQVLKRQALELQKVFVIPRFNDYYIESLDGQLIATASTEDGTAQILAKFNLLPI